MKEAHGIAGKIAAGFINSKLTPLLVIGSILLGVFAVINLAREEEPQIKVPMIDVMVGMPGASAKEVEERVTTPMEKLLWEISGVEYVYSISRPGESLVIVRFEVGQDVEQALVRLNQKLQSNFDRIPPGVSAPIIKPKSIDDVPILALTLHSATHDAVTLRRLAAEVEMAVKQVPDVGETMLIGGERRAIRAIVDPIKLAARNLTLTGLVPILQQANRQSRSGSQTAENTEIVIESGAFLTSADEAGDIVIGVFGGKPVYLREVAEVIDGQGDPTNYVSFGDREHEQEMAVTITVAKRPGKNAVTIAKNVLMKTVGLVTRMLTDSDTGRKLAAVYVPTTPNPTSGYLEIVPADRIVSTDWSVDEAMAFIVSGGAIAPDRMNYDKSAVKKVKTSHPSKNAES